MSDSPPTPPLPLPLFPSLHASSPRLSSLPLRGPLGTSPTLHLHCQRDVSSLGLAQPYLRNMVSNICMVWSTLLTPSFPPLQADIGNFNPASSSGLEGKDVAQLVNPKMRQSTDFPDWLGKAETKEALAGKTVLMYCTGGIRCERASALLRKKLGGAVGDVFQLQGGIEKYLLQFPDGGEN